MIPLPERDPGAPVTPAFAGLVTLVAAFVQVAFLMFLPDAARTSPPAVLGMATIVAFGVALFLAASRIPDPPAAHLGFVRPPPVAWSAALLLVPSILLVSEADNLFRELVPLPEELASATPPGGAATRLSLALLLIVIRPAAEEILFRGFLQPPLTRRWGAAGGVLFVSLMNTLAFLLLNPWSFATLLTSALVLGILRQAARSLLPGLALHALFGLAGLLATDTAFGIPGFDDLSAPHTPLAWLAPAAFLTGIGLALCRAAADRPPPAPPLPGDGDGDGV